MLVLCVRVCGCFFLLFLFLFSPVEGTNGLSEGGQRTGGGEKEEKKEGKDTIEDLAFFLIHRMELVAADPTHGMHAAAQCPVSVVVVVVFLLGVVSGEKKNEAFTLNSVVEKFLNLFPVCLFSVVGADEEGGTCLV